MIRCKSFLIVFTFCWLAFFFLLGSFFSQGKGEKIFLDAANLSPSGQHFLGTDALGRDILTTIIEGGRISLLVGISAAFVALFLGTTVGMLAGYCGGIVDNLLMGLVDILRSIPSLLLLVFWQSLSKPSLLGVVLLIAAVSWVSTARVVRGEVLSLKEREHMYAARALGCSLPRILGKHLFPYLTGKLFALFTLEFSSAVLLETTLSFLGLGLPPNYPSWGNMLSDAQNALLSGYWWQVLFPALACVCTLLLIHLWGEWLSEQREFFAQYQ